MRGNGWSLIAVLLMSLGAITSIHVGAMSGNGSPWGFQDCPVPVNSPPPPAPPPPTNCAPGWQAGVPAVGPGSGGGHPNALVHPDGYMGAFPAPQGYSPPNPYSVWYPPPPDTPAAYAGILRNCMVSPQCAPFPPMAANPSLSRSNQFFGTGPPSAKAVDPLDPTLDWRYHMQTPCRQAGTTPYFFDPIGFTESDPAPSSGPIPLAPTWSPIESVSNDQIGGPATGQYVAYDSIARTPYQDGASYGPNPPYSANAYNDPNVFGNGRFHLENQDTVVQVVGASGSPAPWTVFTANGNPHDMEDVPDLGFDILGDDGYVLGQFTNPVVDAEGFDMSVNIVPTGATTSTFCVYGATSPQGPFTIVMSAFMNSTACDTTLQTTKFCPQIPSTAPGCPQTGAGNEYCFHFDLGYFYTPLRTLCGTACTAGAPANELDYFLIVNSLDHTPYLKADFNILPFDNSLSCIDQTEGQYGYQAANDPVFPACPNTAYAGNPLRGFDFEFHDASVRYGYPMWQTAENGCCVDNPGDIHADPIAAWDWDFSSDLYAVPPLLDVWPNPPGPDTVWPAPYGPPAVADPTPPAYLWPQQQEMLGVNGPLGELKDATDHNRTHTFTSPGVFDACLAVHTNDQIVTDPGGNPWMAVWRQSDPPASDPYPNDPNYYLNDPALKHYPPSPNDMLCRPLTVWNYRPIANFNYAPTFGNPYLFNFYDASNDVDWQMPDSHEQYYHAPMCGDCPPDGIQLRQWVFEDRPFDAVGATPSGHCMPAGVVTAATCSMLTTADNDVRWQFISRQRTDGWTWDPNWPIDATNPELDPAPPGPDAAAEPCDTWVDPSYCFWFASWNNENLHNILHSDTAAFTLSDEGATVTGYGIPAGTTIVTWVDAQDVILSNNVTATWMTQWTPSNPNSPPRYPMTFVVSWPYDVTVDEPTYEYATPDDYLATLSICDHDYKVRQTPAWYGGRTALYGDPQDITWDDPSQTTGISAHACDDVQMPVSVPNQNPHLTVPVNFVVRPGGSVTFTAVGSDVDHGQTLILRLCPGQQLPPGITFDPVELPGNGIQQAFTWNVGALPMGRYGPICFEIADGRYVNGVFRTMSVTHALTTFFIADESTDTDMDGIVDVADDCPGTPNHDQLDSDRDGVGDACEVPDGGFDATPPKVPKVEGIVDQDQDGVADAQDNCGAMANRDQSDLDGDNLGDLCDADADGDGVSNFTDNCPLVANARQEDANRDGGGDTCAGAALANKALANPGLRDSVEPDLAADSTWGVVVGSMIGILAMCAVLVPLLLFALRRHRDDKE